GRARWRARFRPGAAPGPGPRGAGPASRPAYAARPPATARPGDGRRGCREAEGIASLRRREPGAFDDSGRDRGSPRATREASGTAGGTFASGLVPHVTVYIPEL